MHRQKESIAACFDKETGAFRYVDKQGNPMVIEVPKDQYDEAVQLMRQRISNGEIPNVSDPDKAETLVRKGALTKEAANNLAKSGTVESLLYDAKTGVITAGCAAGISTAINFAVYCINGEDFKDALQLATADGLKTGWVAFGTSVIAGQLSKTGVMTVFKPSSEALVKMLGDKTTDALLRSAGKQVSGNAAKDVADAASILRSYAITDAVFLAVMTVPDAMDLFQGRISHKQFVKNFAVNAVVIVAGTAGGVIGTMIVPGVGTIPGALVGSIVAGAGSQFVADRIADYITDDDADEMYEIIQDSFAQKCEDHLMTEDEAAAVAEEFSASLNDDMFKDMYQSKNREQFAEDQLEPLFLKTEKARKHVKEPTEEEMRLALKEQTRGAVFIH